MATLFRTLFGYLFRDGGQPTFYFDEAEWNNLELELAAIAKEEASADDEADMMAADLVIDGRVCLMGLRKGGHTTHSLRS